MNTRKLLSAFLALTMVFSMCVTCILPVIAVDTLATADGKLIGQIYAPAEKWTGNPHTNTAWAVDGDESTYWACSGMNYYTAKTQYFGYYYPTGVVIDSVTVKGSGYKSVEEALAYSTPFVGGTRVEVSNDGSTWQSIWNDDAGQYKNQTVTVNADNWDASVMTEDATWKYVRYAYGTEDNYCGWDMLNVFEFTVTGAYVVPADAAVSFTVFENPVTTTFGTKTNMLAEPLYLNNADTKGVGFLLKVEGLKEGETANIMGIDPTIMHPVTTTTTDEATGEEVETTEIKSYGPGWSANWVHNSPNGYVFTENGYYMYYMPLYAAANNVTIDVVPGETNISALNFFNTGLAYNNGPGKPMTVSEDITITVVGMSEYDIPAGTVFLKDADDTLLGTATTNQLIDTTWNSGSGAWWNKVLTPTDIYDGNGAAPYGSVIDHYEDANGNRVDYILGTATLTAVYGERDVVKYSVEVSDLVCGKEATATIKVDDATVASQGSVTLVYDKTAFSCDVPTIDYTEIAEDGTIGTVKFKVNNPATPGDHTFTLDAVATSDKGDVIVEVTDATATLAGQPAGAYFTGDVVALGDGSSEVNLWEGDVKFSGAIGGMTFVYKLDGIETPIDPGCLDTDFYYSDTAHKNLSSSNWFYNNEWSGGYVRDHMSYEQNGVYYTYLNMRITDGSDDYFYGVKDFAIFHVYNDATAIENANANATAQMLAIVENNLAPTATFHDADGNVIATQTKQYTFGATSRNDSEGNTAKCYGTGLVLTPDELFALSGVAEPTKADNEDGTPNIFTGWADAEGKLVEAVYYNVDLYPVYTSEYLEYAGSASDADQGGETTVEITIPGDADILSGTVNVAFDENVFTSEDAVDGVISLTYDFTPAVELPEVGTEEVTPAAEETTDDTTEDTVEPIVVGTVTLGVKSPVASGEYKLVLSGTAKKTDGSDIFVLDSTATVNVTGEDVTGAFLEGESVVINSAEEGKAPATQTVWSGNVDLGGADIATFIFKIDGVESAMDVTQFAPIVNGTHTLGQNGDTWLWDNFWGADAAGEDGLRANGFAAGMKIEENGTYYVSLARRYIANDQTTKYNTVNGFKLFQTPNTMSNAAATVNYSATNTNTAATFQMLAILAGDLTPTVNFYSEGELVGTYEYKYSALTGHADGAGANTKMKSFGQLVDADDVFAASGLETPVKPSDDANVYVFSGWVGVDGKPVENIYTAKDVYATYSAVPKDTKYVITYMNGEEVFSTEEVYELESPSGTKAAPEKAESATGKYTFAGWALEAEGEVVDISDIKVTDDTTLYAVYTYEDVTFTVTYVSEGKTFYTETVVRSKDAAYAGVPTRATDAYVEGAVGYYHIFNHWAVEQVNEDTIVELVPADLANIQADVTVYAVFDDVEVENWYKVTWLDKDGTELATAMVAEGDDTSTGVKGNYNGKADETTWYAFSGWDTETTDVASDLTVNIIYTETPVATDDDIVITTGSGTVGVENTLVPSDAPYTYVTEGNANMTFIFDIKGASEENPITIGAIRTQLTNGGTQIDSNNSGNYNETKALVRDVTVDGKYYATIGVYVMTWVGGGKYEVVKQLTIDHEGSTRGGTSSGEGTYDVTVIEGSFDPTVRFYDEDGKWLYTGKYNGASGTYAYNFAAVPAPADIYAGAAIENFEAWVDADGNEVTEVLSNMDVYVKTAHIHDWTATGAGTAECATCDETNDAAFTVIAGEATVADVKADDTITVPVIVNNGAFSGMTLNVATSDNVALSDIDATGTLFEGYTAEISEGRVVLNLAESGADAIGNGTVINLILTAKADLAADEEVTVAVTVEEAVKYDDTVITADIADGYTATYVASVTAADIMWGDVDGNGEINGQDAVLLTRYTSRWDESTYADAVDLQIAGDVDGNGEINGQDAVLLTRYTSRWDESTYADAVNLLKSVG